MRCLVTGGAGFIGSHVVRHLQKLGNHVNIMDDGSGGTAMHPDYAIDIASDDMDSAFSHFRPDYVFHLAAYAAENLSHHIRNHNYMVNMVGSANIINACIKHEVKCLVFTSSIAVYGDRQPPFTDSTIPSPIDPYGIAKYATEMDLVAARKVFGLNYVTLRLHNVYGPGQNLGDRYRNVIAIFMNQCLRGEPLTIFGDGEQHRAFSYVEDVAPNIANVAFEKQMYGGTYNVGRTISYSINEVAKWVCEAMKVPENIIHLPARHEAVHSWCVHNPLFECPTTLKQGLVNMAAWVKKHGPVEPKRFDAIEITKNLPEIWK